MWTTAQLSASSSDCPPVNEGKCFFKRVKKKKKTVSGLDAEASGKITATNFSQVS